MTPPAPRFILADAERANDEWGRNCGPSDLAAVTGRALDEIRPLMGNFELKRYTNVHADVGQPETNRCPLLEG